MAEAQLQAVLSEATRQGNPAEPIERALAFLREHDDAIVRGVETAEVSTRPCWRRGSCTGCRTSRPCARP